MSLPKGNKSCPHRKRQVLQSARFCAGKQQDKQIRCNSGRTTLLFLGTLALVSDSQGIEEKGNMGWRGLVHCFNRNNSKGLGAQFRPELLLDGSKIRIQIKIKPANRTRRGKLHSRTKAYF